MIRVTRECTLATFLLPLSSIHPVIFDFLNNSTPSTSFLFSFLLCSLCGFFFFSPFLHFLCCSPPPPPSPGSFPTVPRDRSTFAIAPAFIVIIIIIIIIIAVVVVIPLLARGRLCFSGWSQSRRSASYLSARNLRKTPSRKPLKSK